MKAKRYLSCLLLILVAAAWVGPAPSDVGNAYEPTAVQGGWMLVPVWAAPQPLPPPPVPLDPLLARALRESRNGERLPIILELREQVDPFQAVPAIGSAAERRSRLVAALRSVANRTQPPIRAYLEGAQAAGRVESFASFWIFNGFAIRANPEAIRLLAAHPAVAVVRLDRYRRWLADTPEPASATATAEVEWNVAQIRADEVWHGLGISGTGAVVAGMDTGVDWLHPALQPNYRGFNPRGPSNHAGNWFDAVGGTLYPIDDHGHGTHTMGTAVGREGIGVAPGAQWIAVKVLNGQGYGYDSWIHAGFQWLLAPAGDPSLAPDVVNCSWGNDNGYLTTFQADLRTLRAAGIVPVFSAGNNGPGEGTVGSPASLPEAFAVGATDEYDEVANFSSRGPSPWGEIRPHVAAPGVHIRSALPGGLYGSSNGTSMAAPHVSGLVALLRSISPTLSVTRSLALITSTAVALGSPVPNNDSGWGRIDAFAAAAALTHPGFLTGTVRSRETGLPIAGARVRAVPHGAGGGGEATTDPHGQYLLAVAPGVYDVTGSAFGYEPQTVWNVALITDEMTVLNLSLTPLPSGTLRVSVADAETGDPVTATIAVLDTPVSTIASSATLTLPVGSYTIRARELGYRVLTAVVEIEADTTVTAHFDLPRAPTILLVDSGPWYYESQIGYYRQALDDLGYAYDEWAIRHPPADLPAGSDLGSYDVVVWSAPWDSPGWIGADEALAEFLTQGGRLLISGQDIGYLDGGGVGFAPYYRDLLKAYLVRDSSDTWVLEGTPGELLSGEVITIAGPGGADNQVYPDEVGLLDPDAASPVLNYRGDGIGAVRVGTCLDYRALYLAFGFEGINDRPARQQVMATALDWLDQPPPTAGLELTPIAQTLVGPPGTVVTTSLRLKHIGQAGVTDTFQLSVDSASWGVQVSPPTLTLAPCTSGTVQITVTVPSTAPWDARNGITLTAHSIASPTVRQTAVFTAKAPAPLLLVDDDRWYEQAPVYRSAVEQLGIPYDLWQTCPSVGACWEDDQDLSFLRWYPLVVWWTGYDWYRPVTEDQEAALTDYLEGGGRLFLSSQDFLYYHEGGRLATDYLGVLTYTEDVTPVLAVGVPEDPVGDALGPWILAYPFPNMSDGLEPTPGTAVSVRDQGRRGIGLARREGGHAAVFFAFPFEALPQAVRPQVMERVLGWLSWLGGSVFAPDPRAVPPGGEVTYTLEIRNDGLATTTVVVSNSLPSGVEIVDGSLTGPAAYDPGAREIAWEGRLGPGRRITVSYRAVFSPDLPAGTVVSNSARLELVEHGVRFERTATVRVGTADLSPSNLSIQPTVARPGAVTTLTLHLSNIGPSDSVSATAVVSVPRGTVPVSGSLDWTEGSASLSSHAASWSGTISSGRTITVTWQVSLPRWPQGGPLHGVAFIEDGAGGRWERPAWVWLGPWRVHLPVILRGPADR